jgi:hypothetical protein
MVRRPRRVTISYAEIADRHGFPGIPVKFGAGGGVDGSRPGIPRSCFTTTEGFGPPMERVAGGVGVAAFLTTTAGFCAGGLLAPAKSGGGIGFGETARPGAVVVASSRIDAATTRIGFMRFPSFWGLQAIADDRSTAAKAARSKAARVIKTAGWCGGLVAIRSTSAIGCYGFLAGAGVVLAGAGFAATTGGFGGAARTSPFNFRS